MANLRQRVALVSLFIALALQARAQLIMPLAGRGEPDFEVAPPAAIFAGINGPEALAVGVDGKIYIADTGNERIRLVTDGLTLGTVAGDGVAGFLSNVTLAIQSRLNHVNALAVDATGNLYYNDSGNARIRRIDPLGVVTNQAGNGISGAVTPGILAVSSSVQGPSGLVLDATGHLIFADDNAVYRLESDQTLSLIAGAIAAGFTGDGSPALDARFEHISDLAYGPTGTLYIADAGNQRIRRIDSSGIVSTVIGDGTAALSGEDIPAASVTLGTPTAIAVDSEGRLFYAEEIMRRVRVLDLDGKVRTLVGGVIGGVTYDYVVGAGTVLEMPVDLALEPGGSLLIADQDGHRIRSADLVNLAPDIINEATRSTANLPGSATLTLLETGATPATADVVSITAGRVRSGGLVNLDLAVGDRSNATEAIEVSLDLSSFLPSAATADVQIDGATPFSLFTSPYAVLIFEVIPEPTQSFSVVSVTFPVGNVPSSQIGYNSATGSAVIIDATDLASGQSLSSTHPLNLAFTGDAAGGVISTTLIVDNSPPEIVAAETLVSKDGGASFVLLTTPSVFSNDIVFVSATVQSDSLFSATHNIEALFNGSGLTRISSATDAVISWVTSTTGTALFNYQVMAHVSSLAPQHSPEAPILTLTDELGNESNTPSQAFGINTTGVSLFSSRIFINDLEPPSGAFLTGPDLAPGAAAEVKAGDRISVVAVFAGANDTGLEDMFLDVRSLYPPQWAGLTGDLLPSATSAASELVSATWIYATANLGNATVPQATFTNGLGIGDTIVPLDVNAIPAYATPAALDGVLGSPSIAVQTDATPQTHATVRIKANDTDNGFDVVTFDAPFFTIDTRPPHYEADLEVDPPFRPAPGADPDIPDRARAGDVLEFVVNLQNPKIDGTGDDGFLEPSGFDSLRADLQDFGGGANIAPSATSVLAIPGSASIYTATFTHVVPGDIGLTRDESERIREATFTIHDDAGNAGHEDQSIPAVAIDNLPPLPEASSALLRLISGSGHTFSGNPLVPNSPIPGNSTVDPGSVVQVESLSIFEQTDNPLDLYTIPDLIRIGLERHPVIAHDFVPPLTLITATAVFPVFQFTIPPAAEIEGGAHRIVLTATDTVGNTASAFSSTTIVVTGKPSLRFEADSDDGRIAETDASGKTLRHRAGSTLQVAAVATDTRPIMSLGLTVTPQTELEVSGVQTTGLGTNQVTAILELTPHTGNALGPYTIEATAVNSDLLQTTHSFTLEVDQPPRLDDGWAASIWRGTTLIDFIPDVGDSIEITEEERVELEIKATDPDLADVIQLSATGPIFANTDIESATFAGVTAQTSFDLPLFGPSAAGAAQTDFVFHPGYLFTTHADSPRSTSLTVYAADTGFEVARTIEFVVSDEPVTPTVSVTSVLVDGSPVALSDPISVPELSTLQITVSGQESTGEPVTIETLIPNGAGTTESNGSILRWSFTPGIFDADIPETGSPSQNDSPVDPTTLFFTAVSPGENSSPLELHVNVANRPAAPIVLVTATVGETTIVSPQNTVDFYDGDPLVVEVEAVDPDFGLVFTSFSGLTGGQTSNPVLQPGQTISRYQTILPDDLSVGDSLTLTVTSIDGIFTSTYTLTLHVRKSFERLHYPDTFTATIVPATGLARTEVITDHIEILETDEVTIALAGYNDNPNEVFQFQARGSLLESSQLYSSSFAGQSIQSGNILPFSLAGLESISADVEIVPGTYSAQTGGKSTYTLDLELVAGADRIPCTLEVDILDVDTRSFVFFDPQFSLLVFSATGDPSFRNITNEITLLETDSAVLGVIARSIIPGDPLVLSGTGTVFSSPSISLSQWGGQSVQQGFSLPFEKYGTPPLSETVRIEPGLLAVPLGQDEKSYGLELEVTSFLAAATRAVNVRILNVDRSDELSIDLPFQVVVTDELGGSEIREVTDTLSILETDIISIPIAGGNPDPEQPLILEVTGTAINSAEIADVTFAGRSKSGGDSPPFMLEGEGELGADLSWEPGTAAATNGSIVPYELLVRLNSGDSERIHSLTIQVEDVDVANRIEIESPLQGVITGIDGATRSVQIGTNVDLREDERLEVNLVGIDREGIPVWFIADGTIFGATTFTEVRLGDHLFGPDSVLPLHVEGDAPIQMPLVIEPGFQALSPGSAPKTFTAEFELLDRYASKSLAFTITVQPVSSQPSISVFAIVANGVLLDTTDTVTLDERNRLQIGAILDDQAGGPLNIVVNGPPGRTSYDFDGDTLPLITIVVYQPQADDGRPEPYTVEIAAGNPDGVTATFSITAFVRDTMRPPVLSAGLVVNGVTKSFISEPVIGRDDIVSVTVALSDPDVNTPLTLIGEGTVFNSPLIESATYGRYDPQQGQFPPYIQLGTDTIETAITILPGPLAVPEGMDEALYTIDLNASDGVFGINESIILHVTPSPIAPRFITRQIVADGEPVSIGPVLSVTEGAELQFQIDVIDPLDLQVTASMTSTLSGEKISLGTGTGTLPIVADVLIGVTDAQLPPSSIIFEAQNSSGVVRQLEFKLDVIEFDNPPEIVLSMSSDGEPMGEISDYVEVVEGTTTEITATALDPEYERTILVLAEGLPPEATVLPSSGSIVTAGENPAVLKVRFFQNQVGAEFALRFVAADSQNDGPLGDTQSDLDIEIITSNRRPVLSIDPSGQQTVIAGDVLFVIVSATDADNDLLLLSAYFDETELSENHPQVLSMSGFGELGARSASIIFETYAQDVGAHTLEFHAVDPFWETVKELPLQIDPNPVDISDWMVY